MFDLGGVIMDIERDRAVRALEELGMADAGSVLGNYSQQGVFMALERGEIGPAEFFEAVRPMFRRPVSDAQIEDAFMRFLVGIPVERLREIDRLHSRFKVFMLSNTNPIMWNTFILNEFRKDGHDISYYFDDVVTSFEVKAYKPEERIFRIAQQQFAIKPEETIFLDDSKANCEAAAKLGFQTAWVHTDSPFASYLPECELK